MGNRSHAEGHPMTGAREAIARYFAGNELEAGLRIADRFLAALRAAGYAAVPQVDVERLAKLDQLMHDISEDSTPAKVLDRLRPRESGT